MATRKHLENFLETNGDKKEFCVLLLYECINCIYTTNFKTIYEIHLFLLIENIKRMFSKFPKPLKKFWEK